MGKGLFWKFLFFVLISVIFKVSANPKLYQFKHNSTFSFPGKQLKNHTFEEFSTKYQTLQCAYECLKKPRCKSFNFGKDIRICQLNDGNHIEFPGDLVKNDSAYGLDYHSREAFSIDKEALGPCLYEPCKNGGRCLDTKTANFERTYFCVCTEGWRGKNCDTEEARIGWSNWEDWGPCTVTCGTGWTVRRRRCEVLATGVEKSVSDCFGRDVEFKSCTFQECPRWGEWSVWGDCSTRATCGHGVMVRNRNCTNGGTPGVDRYCKGPTNESAPCEGINCRGLLKLANGTLYGDGRVEMFDDILRDWKLICADDGHWDVLSTDLVCKQIGFMEADQAVIDNAYGSGDRYLTIVLTTCKGSESTIQECVRNVTTSCKHFAGVKCKVMGGWSLWTPWGECSVTCENGTRTRTRLCNHPPPNHHGLACPDDQIQYKDCSLPMCPRIVGSWLPWGQWTPCNATCGEGVRTRYRECNTTSSFCEEGSNQSHVICVMQPCPVDGVWVPWSKWSSCDVTCENGTRFRVRNCTGPFYGGAKCPGPDKEVESCFPRMCPIDGVWNLWSPWTLCTVTCGYGHRNRNRTCNGPFYNGNTCPGKSEDIESCNTFSCPVDGDWKQWEEWGLCSVTCGKGIQNRTRECITPLNGGADCSGAAEESRTCNDFPCPIDGVWTEWAAWSECSVTCANGTRWRDRNCSGPFHGGQNCTGNIYEEEICVTKSCPVDGAWNKWSPWEACNVTCGGGGRNRYRTCYGPYFGGTPCNGSSIESEICNTHECPIDGIWNLWGSWSDCNVTCDRGTRIRFRDCNGPFFGGKNCTGLWSNVEVCNTRECPIDGLWEKWSPWNKCSVTCGGGTQDRFRNCTGPFYGGKGCVGDKNQTQICNDFECPIDGVLTQWSAWYTCDVTCGGGIQWRNRSCDGPYFAGKDCTEPLETFQECNTHPCPIDGAYMAWSAWKECSLTCGGGVQWRNRTCDGPFYGGKPCVGSANDSQSCNQQNCPIDGVWLEWTTWAACNVTCGGGRQWRNRTCYGPFYGGAECDGPRYDSRDCNTHNCPVDGIFTIWNAWGECSTTCGGGIHWRNRTCHGPFYGGQECDGAYNDSQSCNTFSCPVDGAWMEWSTWSNCTVTCGGGISERSRRCNGPFWGGTNCSGNATDTKICSTDPCLIPGDWSPWSPWSLCSLTCGGGLRDRSRICDMKSYGNLTTDCIGNSSEIKSCHTFSCRPLAIHCSDWAAKGLSQSCMADIDPDGPGLYFFPVQVECDFDSEPGKAITVLHHDSEERTKVKGYEGAGEYIVQLTYDIGWAATIKVVDSSAECRQYMKWECFAAVIHNPNNEEVLTTFWKNRTEGVANYFGGAEPGSGKCACGMTHSCANETKRCNCDNNDYVWRLDDGFITDKSELPMHSFYAGDTGMEVEEGVHVLGPVECAGFKD